MQPGPPSWQHLRVPKRTRKYALLARGDPRRRTNFIHQPSYFATVRHGANMIVRRYRPDSAPAQGSFMWMGPGSAKAG